MVYVSNNITGENVTSHAKITKTITDKNGNTVSTVTSSSANTYKVTYKIEYNGKTEYLSNTIEIKGNSTPPPEDPGEDTPQDNN